MPAGRVDRPGRPGQAEDRLDRRADRVGRAVAAQVGRAKLPTWNYTWDLVLANPEQLTKDFAAAGRSGIEGTVEQPTAIRGSRQDVYIGPGRAGAPDGGDRRRATGRSTSTRGRRSIRSRGSRGPATSARSRSCWAPSAARGTRSARSAASAARSRSRSSRATRTSTTTASWATPTWASGSTWGADDQQRPEERLLQRAGHARRPPPDRHRLDQGRLADRRPHEDLDRHAVEHRRVRRARWP